MKHLSIAAAALALLFSLQAAHSQAVVLSNFGNSASSAGSLDWTYNPLTSTITGTEGFGDTVYGTPLFSDIGSNRSIRLSGAVTTAPAGSFTITLEDNAANQAFATFTWTEFSGGATLSKPLDFTTFNFDHITNWSLDSGNSSQSVNATFTQLAAVPESSTWWLIAVGLAILLITRRRTEKKRDFI